MFTGIIRNSGTVADFVPGPSGARLKIHNLVERYAIDKGESIAVNGVCLTAIPDGDGFYADLSPETLGRTTLGQLVSGDTVNLERAMSAGDPLGGHIVQGHVDCVGSLVAIEPQSEFAVYRWSVPTTEAVILVEKGSIAVDGISLTIVEPDETSFGVALIPETLTRTNLGRARVGQLFNIEFDIIGKYIQKLIAPYLARLA